MRIFAAVGAWIIWLSACFCTIAAIYLAATRAHDIGVAGQAAKFKNIFLIICSFLMAVGAFIARRILFFHKRQITLDEIGGVFLWLCLSGFMSSLSFGAVVPGLAMMLAGEAQTWAYVAGGLGAIVLLLALPLLPPAKPQSAPHPQ